MGFLVPTIVPGAAATPARIIVTRIFEKVGATRPFTNPGWIDTVLRDTDNATGVD